MRVAIVAPLVSAIREPQRGGSQAFVSDLARGLVARGHEVHLYCASGSEVPGVQVVDTLPPGRSTQFLEAHSSRFRARLASRRGDSDETETRLTLALVRDQRITPRFNRLGVVELL